MQDEEKGKGNFRGVTYVEYLDIAPFLRKGRGGTGPSLSLKLY
jgi:hypothetical protein